MTVESGNSAVNAGGAAAASGFTFQQRLGAYFGALVLSQRRIDESFQLGKTVPVSVRFETEAPVDDILVGTSENGFIAVQAKTSLPLSSKSNSPFASTISQFLRHWLACRDGGTRAWERPLDPKIDRLVLAVSPRAPATVRHDLPTALRSLAFDPSSPRSTRETRALKVFRACVEEAWKSSTSEDFDPDVFNSLAELIVVYEFDDQGLGRTRTRELMAATLPNGADGVAEARVLEGVSAEMMSGRLGAGLQELRRIMFSQGVELRPRVDFGDDIERLRENSRSVAEELKRHEQIEVTGESAVRIERNCQSAVNKAALGGSLLIVGEAGIGKSGVLNALGRDLEARGLDVVRLAVDRYSVETLEGLSRQIGLDHDLMEILASWDGAQAGWLIIDALDATRGGRGEDVFRLLIESAMKLDNRWNVVATIRSYDLKQGRVFRSLFSGKPPEDDLADLSLANIRHVQIPQWSSTEFEAIHEKSVGLAEVLEGAPDKLVELARVPFNTRLIADLLNERGIRSRLRAISSQSQLLWLYWEHRVERYGIGGASCVFDVVKGLLRHRALRAPFAEVSADPKSLDALCSDGMLVHNSYQWIQFRHHVLFDYSAARFLLASGDFLGGREHLGRGNSRGLLLAPAFKYAMRDRWEQSPDRLEFWSLFEYVVLDEGLDPVVRSAAARVGAEFPETENDVRWFVERLASRQGQSAQSLTKLCRSVAVLFEDERQKLDQPWIWLLGEVAPYVGQLPEAIGILLDVFVGSRKEGRSEEPVGRAARALLEHYQGLGHGPFAIRRGISFVADTYGTNVRESRRLLSRSFEPQRFEQFGFNEFPAVCAKVKRISDFDPDFVVELYQQTYAREVTEDSQTPMSGSQILSLVSNARQDFDMARYYLSKFFERFLKSVPELAVAAVVDAVGGFVDRTHPLPKGAKTQTFGVEGRVVRLQEDLSFVWAFDPEEAHGYDGDALVVTLSNVLKSGDEALVLRIADALIGAASLGVFWSRLFQSAAARRNGLLQVMLPFAMEEPFLVSTDTRKDAIDVLAAGIGGLPAEAREAFERRVLAFDLSRYAEQDKARFAFLVTLFSSIGVNQLVSPEAIGWVKKAETDSPSASLNQRPFRIESGWVGRRDDYLGLSENERKEPEVAGVLATIENAKQLLRLRPENGDEFEGSFEEACEILEEVGAALRQVDLTTALLEEGESTIADGCLKLVERRMLPPMADRTGTDRFVHLISVVCGSASPQVDDSTETSFASFASWSAPAVRVIAGELVLRTISQRPDLLDRLKTSVDRLLTDDHPAVRMKTSLHLTSLWGADRPGFWDCVRARVERERNVGVLKFLISDLLGRVLAASPHLVEEFVLALSERLQESDDIGSELREAIAQKVAIIAVRYQGTYARSLLNVWIQNPVGNESELLQVARTLREAYAWGLVKSKAGDDQKLRSRALAVAAAIVRNAKSELDAARDDPDGVARGQSLARIIDTVCSELYFGSDAGPRSRRDDGSPEPGLEIFLDEVRPTLELIAACGIPHSTYQLVEMLEFLLPLDPEKVFDLLAYALLSGGDDAPFKFESMGADIVVRVVGRLLADHRSIFDDDDRRESLIRCLEVFVEVGWPSARRLMYELPEIFH